jgi:hypothetical protein
MGVLGAAALAVRVVRARQRRILHPKGRSFTGTLQIDGTRDRPTGSRLIDEPGSYPVTVRVSKGGGTPGGLPDVLGLSVRVHGPGPAERRDMLFSTCGTTRVTRHLPAPRRGFDTAYGSILAYRTGGPPAQKVYLMAVSDPDGPPWGRTLDAVVRAATGPGVRVLLYADDVPFATVTFGAVLPESADAELAFDPVHNTTDDLHPTGLVHASRGLAYRAAQRWRGARPAPADPGAVTRTAAHR